MSEKYFDLNELPIAAIESNGITPDKLFPIGAQVRAGDLMIEVTSHNKEKRTVSFKLLGIWLQPKTDADGSDVDVIEPKPAPIILTPNKRIITP